MSRVEPGATQTSLNRAILVLILMKTRAAGAVRHSIRTENKSRVTLPSTYGVGRGLGEKHGEHRKNRVQKRGLGSYKWTHCAYSH